MRIPFISLILHVFPRYSTACAESDYTDRDTDREEGEGEREPDQESEEEEDRSCATVLTLRQEDSQEDEVEERVLEEEEGEEQEEDEGKLQLGTEVPSGELALLLAQTDILHTGDASLKAEGFRLLLDSRAEVRDRTYWLYDGKLVFKLRRGRIEFNVFILCFRSIVSE